MSDPRTPDQQPDQQNGTPPQTAAPTGPPPQRGNPQPQYGQQPAQPQYGQQVQPQYGQPQYGQQVQPQYGQPQYGQPAQPQYAPPRDYRQQPGLTDAELPDARYSRQPSYDAAHFTPGYEVALEPQEAEPTLVRTQGVTVSALATAPADIRAETMQHAAPVFAAPPPQPHTGRRVALIIGIVVAGLALLLALVYTLIALGVASIFAAVLALIPLTVVLLAIRWVDRWEPEPLGIKIFAFLWGAGVAVVTALVVGVGVDVALYISGSNPGSGDAQFLGAVVQAPIVEEGAKGLGILLIFLIGRKYFDGPVDGIVYGATIAAGFAFTENILYFGQQMLSSGLFSGEVVTIFFLRGVLAPFAHVMFTSMTGLALGLAASRFKHWAPSVGFYFVGLLGAMLLHGIWNAAASLVPGGIPGYLLYYCVVEVPLFIGLLVIVFWLRRRESRQTLARLAEYAAAGWINRDEVVALGSPAGRRQARAWAASRGQKALMGRYIRDATMLAAARQRVIRDTGRAEAQSDELVLLGKVTASRRALLGVGG
ncbi:hypothetical protein GCM10027515_24330 [Schumannella luteola]|uniref:RsiW-degrading membrane proteinase PrsW (M82 family) n=1 Tax=Schumannella luteola TaxID=472059 RepID=A0A852YPW4_9MICO|nr:PrsW family intramembrane metalloprotease [Schumannella luteola]NYG99769.1 RsiW-degrading membrane proteinase PrsW (M82 family) [Schumannella luteola]